MDARWDLFLVPKPFSTVFVRYADPVYVPRDADDSAITAIGDRVERTLVELTEQTDADARR